MIAFDTNVLLRLLLDDEVTQSRQVEAIVRHVAAAEDCARNLRAEKDDYRPVNMIFLSRSAK